VNSMLLLPILLVVTPLEGGHAQLENTASPVALAAALMLSGQPRFRPSAGQGCTGDNSKLQNQQLFRSPKQIVHDTAGVGACVCVCASFGDWAIMEKFDCSISTHSMT